MCSRPIGQRLAKALEQEQKPNQLVRERPYIAHNIEMTRQAYALDRMTQREFPAETTVAAVDAASKSPSETAEEPITS